MLLPFRPREHVIAGGDDFSPNIIEFLLCGPSGVINLNPGVGKLAPHGTGGVGITQAVVYLAVQKYEFKILSAVLLSTAIIMICDVKRDHDDRN
jgi:hypothetical protein